jgi:hypothetical protein
MVKAKIVSEFLIPGITKSDFNLASEKINSKCKIRRRAPS